MLAVQAVGEHQPSQLVRAEASLDEIRHRAGQETGQAVDVGGGRTAQPQTDARQLAQTTQATARKIRRWLEKERLQVRGEAMQLVVCREETLDVLGRVPLELRAHARAVVPPAHDGAVLECGLHARLAREHAQAVRPQLEIADDFGPQHAGDVRGGRDAAAGSALGVDLFGNRTAADDLAAFEYQHAQTAACEIGRGRQSVVSCAHDDDVVSGTGRHRGLPFVLNPARGPDVSTRIAATAMGGMLEIALDHAARLLESEPALAVAQATEILKAVPDYPPAMLLLGKALAASGRGEEAVTHLRRTLQIAPDLSEAWRALADHLRAIGDDRGADAAAASALKASTRDPRLQEAAAALCENRIAAAEALLRKHLGQQPNDVAALRLLAEVGGAPRAFYGRGGAARALPRSSLRALPPPGRTTRSCSTARTYARRRSTSVDELLARQTRAIPAARDCKAVDRWAASATSRPPSSSMPRCCASIRSRPRPG